MINIPGGCLREPYARLHHEGAIVRARNFYSAPTACPYLACPSHLILHEMLHTLPDIGFALTDLFLYSARISLPPMVF
jgi:hypothetical protein